MRVSFEKTPGGGFQFQLRINQLQTETSTSDNLVFYATVYFAIATIIEIYTFIRRISKRKFGADSIFSATFIAIDGYVIFYWVDRLIHLNAAMKMFELDPRSRPPFDRVFFAQRHLQAGIAFALFFRSLFLLNALSGLNSVKGILV